MSDSRTHNSVRNIKWGMLHRVVSIFLPFIVRTLIITKLGVEYVGINSLFSSLLQVLSLSELGFESAVVIVMYKDVVEQNKDRIGALLLFLKSVYKVVGLLIVGIGLAMLPFLGVFIKDINEVPSDVNVYIIYLLFLINSSASYFFGGYRQSQLVAYQRNDIVSKITLLVYIVMSFAQIIVLMTLENYYAYMVLLPISTICTNVWLLITAKRKNPEIKLEGKISKDDRGRIKKLVLGSGLAKLGAILCVTLDNVVISSFLGIYILGLYNNYSYIVSAVVMLLRVVYISIQGSVGNSVASDTVDKNFYALKVFNFGYNWLLVWCSLCIVFLIQPFIAIWLGNSYMLPNYLCVILGLYLYVSESVSLINVYKYAIGILWEDWYRPIVMGSVNLALNIAIVLCLSRYNQEMALTGVLLSSIIAYLFINNPWLTWTTFKYYFKKGFLKFYLKHSSWLLVFLFLVVLLYPIFKLIPVITGANGIVNLILRVVVIFVLPNLMMYFGFKNNDNYKTLERRFFKRN